MQSESEESPASLERGRRATAMLIGVAAHDLRTPLNAMAGWLQLMQSSPDLPAATRERALKGLQLAIAQQTGLADGLSQLAAVEAGELEFEAVSVDINAALHGAANALQAEAAAKTVELLVAGTAPLEIASDAQLIGVLLRNLLAGALKFTTKASRMDVRASLEAGWCEIRIELSRALVSAENIGNLLVYVRGGEIEKPNRAGAAFALTVAQRLAGFLGGSLQANVESSPEHVILTMRFRGSA
jgi:signal transduction histidine kinase